MFNLSHILGNKTSTWPISTDVSMSAESHRKQSREKSTGKVILPQIVEDKSLIDSFTGFIQDVVPQVKNSLLKFPLWTILTFK